MCYTAVVWSLSNEITMQGEADADLLENHRLLNDPALELDKTRLTTMAAVSLCPIDRSAPSPLFGWWEWSVV